MPADTVVSIYIEDEAVKVELQRASRKTFKEPSQQRSYDACPIRKNRCFRFLNLNMR